MHLEEKENIFKDRLYEKQHTSYLKKRITALVGVDCLLAMLLFSNTFIRMS